MAEDDSFDDFERLEMHRQADFSTADAESAALKQGWLTDTKTSTRWYCILHQTVLDLFESQAAAKDWTKPQRSIELGVCSDIQLGGILQNTLRIGADSETKVLTLWSDFSSNIELRCERSDECNSWYNSLSRIFDASRQMELEALAELDLKDMQMRFRHARLWGLQKVSAPEPLPRSQWMPSHAVSVCTYCDDEFQSEFTKHHCRLCGDVFCAAHSKVARDLEFTDKPYRVCVWCFLIWSEYAQGIRDGDISQINLLGDVNEADVQSELKALRDYRRQKAKDRQAAAAVCCACVHGVVCEKYLNRCVWNCRHRTLLSVMAANG